MSGLMLFCFFGLFCTALSHSRLLSGSHSSVKPNVNSNKRDIRAFQTYLKKHKHFFFNLAKAYCSETLRRGTRLNLVIWSSPVYRKHTSCLTVSRGMVSRLRTRVSTLACISENARLRYSLWNASMQLWTCGSGEAFSEHVTW